MVRSNPIPSDALVALRADLIGEGQFIAQLDDAIAEASALLQRRKEARKSAGKVRIVAHIELSADDEVEDIVGVKFSVESRNPKNESMSMVKHCGGLLLCSPDGSRNENPDQMRLFDRKGRPIGVMDAETGEILDEPAVAGRVAGRKS